MDGFMFYLGKKKTLEGLIKLFYLRLPKRKGREQNERNFRNKDFSEYTLLKFFFNTKIRSFIIILFIYKNRLNAIEKKSLTFNK